MAQNDEIIRHPVRASGLSADHVNVFDKIATNDISGVFDTRIINDLLNKRLLEKNAIGNLQIPLVVYIDWSNWNNKIDE